MVKILRENGARIQHIPLDCVETATLLSVEEAENLLTQAERKCEYEGEPHCWWLRTPGRNSQCACYVYTDGSIYNSNRVDYTPGVRPALNLRRNLQVGDIFQFGDYKFKTISNRLAICEEIIGQTAFRRGWRAKDANVYEKSDIKKYINKWFKEQIKTYKGIKTDKMIADENDLGF